MMSSATHVVIGSADLAASRRFLALFDFETVTEGILDAAAAQQLYGQEVDSREVVLASPGSATGWLRLVETAGRYSSPEPSDPRSLAVVVETRDLERSLERASAAGMACGEPVTDAMRKVREAVVEGPSELKLLLRQPASQAGTRRGFLRGQSVRLHSEVTGVLWSAYTFNIIDLFWGDENVGLIVKNGYVAPKSAVIVQASGIERQCEALPYKRVTDPWQASLSLELFEIDDSESGPRPTWPLARGLHAVAFQVSNLDHIRPWMDNAAYSKTVTVNSGVHRKSQGVTMRGPGRVRFEVWLEESPIPLPVN